MKWLPISFVVVALMTLSACSGPRSPRQDLDRLQGTWRVESSSWNGVEDPEIAKTITILFQDDKFIVVDRDGIRQQPETVRLLPSQNPKAIDFWSKDGSQPGIYSLEGDVFKWCSAGGGNQVRPTSFASTPGSKQSLLVLRRDARKG